MNKYLLIDNGGTQIKYALAYEDGTLIENSSFDTPSKKLPNALDLYFTELDKIVEKYKSQDIKGICISCPGRIEEDGHCSDAGALPYFIGVNFITECKNRYGLDASIENDAKCAAIAELMSGSLEGVKNGMVITIGTGLGGGVITNGQVVRGSNFCAGEISAIPMNLYNQEDENDTASAIISTKSITKMVADKLGLDATKMNGKDTFEYINKNDEGALQALDEFCMYLSRVIYTIQIVLDCEKFAIGGGISAQPKLIEYLKKNVHKAFSLPWLFSFGGLPPVVEPEIVVCKYHNEANLIGALYDFKNKYNK